MQPALPHPYDRHMPDYLRATTTLPPLHVHALPGRWRLGHGREPSTDPNNTDLIKILEPLLTPQRALERALWRSQGAPASGVEQAWERVAQADEFIEGLLTQLRGIKMKYLLESVAGTPESNDQAIRQEQDRFVAALMQVELLRQADLGLIALTQGRQQEAPRTRELLREQWCLDLEPYSDGATIISPIQDSMNALYWLKTFELLLRGDADEQQRTHKELSSVLDRLNNQVYEQERAVHRLGKINLEPSPGISSAMRALAPEDWRAIRALLTRLSRRRKALASGIERWLGRELASGPADYDSALRILSSAHDAERRRFNQQWKAQQSKLLSGRYDLDHPQLAARDKSYSQSAGKVPSPRGVPGIRPGFNPRADLYRDWRTLAQTDGAEIMAANPEWIKEFQHEDLARGEMGLRRASRNLQGKQIAQQTELGPTARLNAQTPPALDDLQEFHGLEGVQGQPLRTLLTQRWQRGTDYDQHGPEQALSLAQELVGAAQKDGTMHAADQTIRMGVHLLGRTGISALSADASDRAWEDLSEVLIYGGLMTLLAGAAWDLHVSNLSAGKESLSEAWRRGTSQGVKVPRAFMANRSNLFTQPREMLAPVLNAEHLGSEQARTAVRWLSQVAWALARRGRASEAASFREIRRVYMRQLNNSGAWSLDEAHRQDEAPEGTEIQGPGAVAPWRPVLDSRALHAEHPLRQQGEENERLIGKGVISEAKENALMRPERDAGEQALLDLQTSQIQTGEQRNLVGAELARLEMAAFLRAELAVESGTDPEIALEELRGEQRAINTLGQALEAERQLPRPASQA